METRSGRWLHTPLPGPHSLQPVHPSKPFSFFNILEASRLTAQLLSSQGPVPRPTMAAYWDLEQNLTVTVRSPYPRPLSVHSAVH